MAKAKQLKKYVSEKRKIIKKLDMSKQQEVWPDCYLCMADKITSDQKQQIDNELFTKVGTDLDAKGQCTTEYSLGYTMTVKVRFSCTQ
jgi:hypothetical protein